MPAGTLSIWPLLETPRFPLSDAHKNSVLEGAAIAGFSDIDPSIGTATLLKAEVDVSTEYITDLGVEHFIGYTIGIRAVEKDLEVTHANSSGFTLSGRELSELQLVKPEGVRRAQTSPDRRYQELLRDVIDLPIIHGKEVSSSVGFLGFLIGVREAQLKGVAV